MKVEFSNTKPNETVRPSGWFIDFRGTVHGTNGSTLTIQGGDNKGAFSRNSEEASPFFMTDSQRRALMIVLKEVAFSEEIVTSSNGDLEVMCNAIVDNYRG